MPYRHPRAATVTLALSILSACVVVVPSGAPGDASQVVAGSQRASAMGAAALREANAARAEIGLPALRSNPRLQAAAKSHSDWMAQVGRQTHTGAGGGNVATRLKVAGYCYRAAKEALAYGYRNAPRVVAGWVASPSHRPIVLDRRAVEGAVAVTRGSGSIWWTMVTAVPC